LRPYRHFVLRPRPNCTTTGGASASQMPGVGSQWCPSWNGSGSAQNRFPAGTSALLAWRVPRAKIAGKSISQFPMKS